MNHIAEVKPEHGQKVWVRTWFDVNSRVAVYDAERNMWHPDGYGKSYPVSDDEFKGDHWEPYGPVPRKGAIAVCGAGHLGVITSDSKETVRYPDGETSTAWPGIHLAKDKLGSRWSSREPRIIGHVDDLPEILEQRW